MNRTPQPRRLRSPRDRVGQVAKVALPPPRDEEATLIEALRRRDEAAFERLLDRLHSAMLGVAKGYVRTRAEAEDVVQEAWIGVLRGIDRFEGRSTLRTWIFRILVNRARSRARRAARSLPFSEITGPAAGGDDGFTTDSDAVDRLLLATSERSHASGASTQPDPEAGLLAGELASLIRKEIDRLPTRQQQVITLRDIEGWSAAEVCDLLRISESNQRVLLHRARIRVRDALRPYIAVENHDNQVEAVPL